MNTLRVKLSRYLYDQGIRKSKQKGDNQKQNLNGQQQRLLPQHGALAESSAPST